jgi:hypothetical protein
MVWFTSKTSTRGFACTALPWLCCGSPAAEGFTGAAAPGSANISEPAARAGPIEEAAITNSLLVIDNFLFMRISGHLLKRIGVSPSVWFRGSTTDIGHFHVPALRNIRPDDDSCGPWEALNQAL